MAEICLALRNLTKQFGSYKAVDAVNLDIFEGEFITLLGPSGSGKTTCLMMVAGLVEPTGGDILLWGERINDLPAHKRGIGVVFQHYETIFVVSYLTRAVSVGTIDIQYRQTKGPVLTNTSGIEHKDGYFIASTERAFLDAVYIYKDYHFDNLGVIDWKEVSELKKIYHSNSLEKRVEKYQKLYKEDYGKQSL